MTAATTPTPAISEPRLSDARTSLMVGALAALVFANVVQIAVGIAGVDPSPPADVLPLIAATATMGIAAIPMVRTGQRAGAVLGIAFCIMSMIGMGPHKLFLEDGAVIAPMAIVGFVLEVTFIRVAVAVLRTRD